MDIQQEVSKSVLNTFAFFAIFNKPLKKEDVIQYYYVTPEKRSFLIYSKNHKADIFDEIDKLLNNSKLFEKKNDLYYLKIEGLIYRDDLISNEDFVKKAKAYTWLFQIVPFLDGLAVSNTVAFGSARKTSDIDIFGITKSKHVWDARLFLTGFLHVFKMRCWGDDVAGKFCPSFCIDCDVLDLSIFLFEDNDIYFRFWLVTLKPLFGKDAYEKFIDANQRLINETFPFWDKEKEIIYFKETNFIIKFLKKLMETLLSIWPFNILLKEAKERQWRHLCCDLVVTENKSRLSSAVVMNDQVMKNHINDRREEIKGKWDNMVNSEFNN